MTKKDTPVNASPNSGPARAPLMCSSPTRDARPTNGLSPTTTPIPAAVRTMASIPSNSISGISEAPRAPARVVRLPRIDHGHHSDHGKRRHGLPHHRRCLAQQDTNHAGRRFLYRHHRTAGRLGQADGRSGLSAARQLPTGGHTHHGHIIGEAHPFILSQRPFQHVRHEGSTARAQASTRGVHSRGKEKTIEIIQNDRFCRSF